MELSKDPAAPERLTQGWRTRVPILVPPDPDMLGASHAILRLLGRLPLPLLYVGPDQLLPLASVFTAITGVAIMFWHKLVAGARKVAGLFTRRPRSPQSEPTVEDRA